MTHVVPRIARWAAVVATAGLAVGGVAACSSGGSDGPPATTTATTTTIAVAAAPELLSDGVAPRRVLRPSMHAGDSVVVRLATDVVVHQSTGGREQRLDTPPIVQLVRLTVRSADDDGYVLRAVVESAGVEAKGTGLDADRVAALDDQIGELEGLRATIRVDVLGRPTAVALDTPAGLGDEAAAAIESLRVQLARLAPSLPLEAVGVGARWRMPASAGEGELDLAGTQTVTITAIDGDRISYEVAIDVHAGEQELVSGAHLQTAQVAGSGSGWFDLSSPAYQLDVTTNGTAAMRAEDGTVEQRTQTVSRAAPVTG